VTIPAALLVSGLITHRAALKTSAERTVASLAVAGVLVTVTKFVVGRERPFASEEPTMFRPFSGADAFPSGHTTMAFALATALSDEIHHTWATVGFFTMAGATGWSRLNDNKHWFSDVLAGAALGITSAQVMEKRWNLRVTPVPGGVAVSRGGRKRS
jgi:membrane-associated phospholipid phosphatase